MYHKFSCTINLNNFIGYVSDVKNGKKKVKLNAETFAETFIQYWEIRRFHKTWFFSISFLSIAKHTLIFQKWFILFKSPLNDHLKVCWNNDQKYTSIIMFDTYVFARNLKAIGLYNIVSSRWYREGKMALLTSTGDGMSTRTVLVTFTLSFGSVSRPLEYMICWTVLFDCAILSFLMWF